MFIGIYVILGLGLIFLVGGWCMVFFGDPDKEEYNAECDCVRCRQAEGLE